MDGCDLLDCVVEGDVRVVGEVCDYWFEGAVDSERCVIGSCDGESAHWPYVCFEYGQHVCGRH